MSLLPTCHFIHLLSRSDLTYVQPINGFVNFTYLQEAAQLLLD